MPVPRDYLAPAGVYTVCIPTPAAQGDNIICAQVKDRASKGMDRLKQLQQKRDQEQQYYKQQQELIRKYRLKRQQSQAKKLAKVPEQGPVP